MEMQPRKDYCIAMFVNEATDKKEGIHKFMKFFMDGVAVMNNGKPEIRLPIFGGGTNYCIYFRDKQDFERALEKTKKIIKTEKLTYIRLSAEKPDVVKKKRA